MNLAKIRNEKNLSQSELAKKSSVSIRMIQYYETGYKDINKASGTTLYKLSKSLNCNIEDLLELNQIEE